MITSVRVLARLLFAASKVTIPEMRVAATTPAWKLIHEAADRFKPRAQAVTLRAFNTAKRTINRKTLELALEKRDEKRVIAIMNGAIDHFGDLIKKPIAVVLADVHAAAGHATVKNLTKQLRAAAFNPDQPRDDSGKFAPEGGGGGSKDIDDADRHVIDQWAWPAEEMGGGDPKPGTMSYAQMRNPNTREGKATTATLEKLPIHDGVTFRGLSLSESDLQVLTESEDFTLKLHSSSSKDEDVAVTFADANSVGGREGHAVIMEFHGRGRDINSHLPEELQGTKEVVLMAGTKYKFKSITEEMDRSLSLKYMRVVLEEKRS